MRTAAAVRVSASFAVAAALLAGCNAHPVSASGGAPTGRPGPPAGTSGASATVPVAGSIPLGPGPQAHYTVQQQPPAGSCHYRTTAGGEPLPDPHCTPGARNPAVTQATIHSTICKPGYTATIRPPASVTGAEKKLSEKSYGTTSSPGVTEYDHLLSLEDGGDPNDPRNLWPESPDPGHTHGINNAKDPVETKLKSAVCAGKVTLAAAQQALVQDWTTALSKLGLG